MPSAFHEVLFPLDIALKSAGGPERRTEIVTLGSGREERNARWAHSRRRYDAGYGVRTFAALSTVVAFFEERRGRLYGFRWRDRLDHSSAAAGAPGPLDQTLGGLVRVPQITRPGSRGTHEFFEAAHQAVAWILAALVLLHVAAAIYHWKVRRDDVMHRMLPGGGGA